MSTTNSCEPFFNGTLLDLKNLKKKEKKERKRKQGLLDALISLTIRHKIKQHDLTLKRTFLLLNRHYENDMHVMGDVGLLTEGQLFRSRAKLQLF